MKRLILIKHARPRVDPDYTATVGLSREQGRALIAAADADSGRARLRSAAVIRLLLHNALRVDEVLGADVTDLGADRGHLSSPAFFGPGFYRGLYAACWLSSQAS